MSVTGNISAKIANSFIGYLNLGSWLDLRLKSLVSGRKRRDFQSVEEFWNAIFCGELHHGDRVRFKNSFVTDWLPRQPGSAWKAFQTSTKGHRGDLTIADLRSGQKMMAVESVLDNGIPSPLGVVRLGFGTDRKSYAALSLTTIDSWCCDLGIPTLVSSSVYDAFVSRRHSTNAVEVDLEGVLQLRDFPLLDPSMVAALGADVDEPFLQSLITPMGHPLAFLRVLSPLDVRMRTHNAAPPGYLWSISRDWRTHNVFHQFGENQKTQDIRLEPIDPEWCYGFHLIGGNISDPNVVENFTRAFRVGNVTSFISDDEPSLSRGIEKVEVLTEFDSRAQHFATAVPLQSNPWSERGKLEKISRALSDLQKQASPKTPGGEQRGDAKRE